MGVNFNEPGPHMTMTTQSSDNVDNFFTVDHNGTIFGSFGITVLYYCLQLNEWHQKGFKTQALSLKVVALPYVVEVGRSV